MHSDVSSTIYSESTMEPDNNHVFQSLSLALLFLHIFSLESQKEDKLKPLEHQK